MWIVKIKYVPDKSEGEDYDPHCGACVKISSGGCGVFDLAGATAYAINAMKPYITGKREDLMREMADCLDEVFCQREKPIIPQFDFNGDVFQDFK